MKVGYNVLFDNVLEQTAYKSMLQTHLADIDKPLDSRYAIDHFYYSGVIHNTLFNNEYLTHVKTATYGKHLKYILKSFAVVWINN